jgi:HlyD family secretion protein
MGAIELGLQSGGKKFMDFGAGEAPQTRSMFILGGVTALGFLGATIAWGAYLPLAESASASGVIKVEGTRRTLSHLEGGVVREILVRDGDHVEAGQVLMRLDDAQSGAIAASLMGQKWSLVAQVSRLAAELSGREVIDFPAPLLGAAQTNEQAREAVSGQRSVLETRLSNMRSQVLVLEARVAQAEGQIQSARGQLASSRSQLFLTRQEESQVLDLYRQGLERQPRLLALQRNVAALEGSIGDLNGQIQRAMQTAAESRQQMVQLVDQRMQEASAELRDARGKVDDIAERLRAAVDVSNRREILAPEAGTVLNLRVFTLGSAIRGGDPVLDLVPSNDRLIAEVNLSSSDVDVVYPGLQAEIRLPAYKQRLVPYLHGRVLFVSSDVTIDERTRSAYYKSYVSIDQDQLDRLQGVRLVPGMPAEAVIQIGRRSWLRSSLQPMSDSLARAFREQ